MSWLGDLTRVGIDPFLELVHARIPDISSAAAGSNTVFVSSPVKGKIEKVETVISNAITTGDAVLSFATTTGAITETLTIANAGSAAGDTDSVAIATSQANAAVDKSDTIKIVSDGGSTVACNLGIMITIRRSIT